MKSTKRWFTLHSEKREFLKITIQDDLWNSKRFVIGVTLNIERRQFIFIYLLEILKNNKPSKIYKRTSVT